MVRAQARQAGWKPTCLGSYSLGGTAGQPDAGLLTGEGYTIGGFWGGGAQASEEVGGVYLPIILKSY